MSAQTVGLLLLSNVFVPFAVFYMLKPLTPDYLWAALCMVGGVFHFWQCLKSCATPAAARRSLRPRAGLNGSIPALAQARN